MTEEQLRFILPQLCHLISTHNRQSGAIEKFVIEQCLQSSHLALEVSINFNDRRYGSWKRISWI